MKIIVTFFLQIVAVYSYAQSAITCYPANWWTGMKYSSVQLMLHGEDIGNAKNISFQYPGVQLKKVNKVENKNWLFLDINITATARPGRISIRIDDKTVPFELKQKRKTENGKTRVLGVTSEDFIYLIMPDRFANGDPSNDIIAGMQEIVHGRDSLKGRHGGDLQGITKHLDYLKDLGVTAIWLNPVIENDMRRESFHGYAFTNHYKIDPRLGGDAAYSALINTAHSKGIKIIQDAVYNHVGLNHITVKDKPMKDWLNEWPAYTNTTYKDQVLVDQNGSLRDKKIMSDGWFTPFMPDLNQRNPFVANFLIQHALWTVENFGIDGWRIDTYAYCDLEFMNRCNKALLDEYPQLGIFGETWVNALTNQAYFVKNNFNIPFKSNLPGVTDFQLHFAMNDALNQKYGWTEGISKLNHVLSSDLVYADPQKNCIFLDNHDITRFYTVVGENFDKYKIGINWLLTIRGIPQIYYGTEILMTGSTHPSDALVRKDFPGGWASDSVNKFVSTGRTAKENEAFKYVKTLANFRKNSSALKTGKMMQFVPFDGLFVFFRYDAKETIMVISNTDDKPVKVGMERYQERIAGYKSMKDIFSGKTYPLSEGVEIGAMGSGVFKLQ